MLMTLPGKSVSRRKAMDSGWRVGVGLGVLVGVSVAVEVAVGGEVVAGGEGSDCASAGPAICANPEHPASAIPRVIRVSDARSRGFMRGWFRGSP